MPVTLQFIGLDTDPMPPRNGTIQQRDWVRSAMAKTSYDFAGCQLVVKVLVLWEDALLAAADPDTMCTVDTGTGSDGTRNFTVTIYKWADDPTAPGNAGIADLRAYYEQSFVHQLAHVVVDSVIKDVYSGGTGYISRFAGLFWKRGTDHQYGTIDDWGGSGIAWADSIEQAVADCFKCGFYTGTLLAPGNRTNWLIDEGDPPFGAPPGTPGVNWSSFVRTFGYPLLQHYEVVPWQGLDTVTAPGEWGPVFPRDASDWGYPTLGGLITTDISYTAGPGVLQGITTLIHSGPSMSPWMMAVFVQYWNVSQSGNYRIEIDLSSVAGHTGSSGERIIQGFYVPYHASGTAPVSDADWAAGLYEVTKDTDVFHTNPGSVPLPDSGAGTTGARGLWIGVMAHPNGDWEAGYWIPLNPRTGLPYTDPADVPRAMPYFMQPFNDPSPPDPLANASAGKTLWAGPNATMGGMDHGAYQGVVQVNWRAIGTFGSYDVEGPMSLTISLGGTVAPASVEPPPTEPQIGGGFLFGGDYNTPYLPSVPYPFHGGLSPGSVAALVLPGGIRRRRRIVGSVAAGTANLAGVNMTGAGEPPGSANALNQSHGQADSGDGPSGIVRA